jgi:hypothetical protein
MSGPDVERSMHLLNLNCDIWDLLAKIAPVLRAEIEQGSVLFGHANLLRERKILLEFLEEFGRLRDDLNADTEAEIEAQGFGDLYRAGVQ